MKKTVLIAITVLIILSTMLVNSTVAAQGGAQNAIAEVNIQASSITWTPIINNIKGMTLTITGPGNFYFQKQYDGSAPQTISNENLKNGAYVYEIVLRPDISPDSGADPALRGLNSQSQSGMKQSGAFTVLDGSFVTPAQEPQAGANNASIGSISQKDIVNADDVIISGSLCIGFDCVDGESFGFDTLRFKENNTRITFDDTSATAGFPANDWTIVANDSASGGANYLGFEDVTGAKFPFKVTAGAPTNSLFVSSTGNLGLGTSTPVLDIHVVNGNTPGLRLDQDSSGGYTAQTWDVVGNEANFFVRDVTGGSRLPFRIRPGAPTSSIDIAASGNVGIGTSSPVYDLDVANTGASASMAVRQTDGATLKLLSGAALGSFGTENNFPLSFFVNNTAKMTLAANGNVGIGTDSPTQNLDVATTGASASMAVRQTDGATLKLLSGAALGSFGTENNFPLSFFVNNTAKMTLAANGNVGIGTDSPTQNLDVATTGASASMAVRQTDGATLKFLSNATQGIVGTDNNFPLDFFVNGASKMTLAANGYVGIGTASPTQNLDIVTTGVNATADIRRTDAGADLRFTATQAQGKLGTVNNFPLTFMVNNVGKMSLATSGALTVFGPVNATAFNVTSDKNVKENFAAIDRKTVLERLSALPISTWNFIENDNKTKHMGPMAQDFYAAFGLGGDDKHISTVDADGVAIAAIQELNQQNQALSSENAALRGKVDDLAARVSSLESGAAPAGQSSQNGMIVLLAGMNLALMIVLVWAIRRGAFAATKPGNR